MSYEYWSNILGMYTRLKHLRNFPSLAVVRCCENNANFLQSCNLHAQQATSCTNELTNGYERRYCCINNPYDD